MRSRLLATARMAMTVAVAVPLVVLLRHDDASAAPLVIAPSYPQRVGGRPPAQGINHAECASPIEKWRFAFAIPAVTFTELQVFARKTPGSCIDPSERATGGACHRVARFDRATIDAGPVDIPSAAMITAGDLAIDVADFATIDRDEACFPDGDRNEAPLTLSMLLFDGASGVDEATYATSYDLAAPEPPRDLAATADGTTVHATFGALSSTTGVKALHGFCFDLDTSGDSGNPPCAIPLGFVVHDRFVKSELVVECASVSPKASALDLFGLVPGHHYVFTVAVVDDQDNTGPLAAPACLQLSAVTPVEGDAGPPPLPPVNACACRTTGGPSEGAGWASAALPAMLTVITRWRLRRRAPPRTVA